MVFAGQGKLMIFGLGIGVTALIGLGFLTLAPQSANPLTSYVIGLGIMGFGVGGGLAYYLYVYLIEYTKYGTAIGALLRPGFGQPTGEIWVLNKRYGKELVDEIKEETKPPESPKEENNSDSENPQTPKVEEKIAVDKLKDMIPEEAKSYKDFRYYLLPHIGDTTRRELIITQYPFEACMQYFPEEVMINDLPRRINLGLATFVLKGRHDIFIPPEPKSKRQRFGDFIKRVKTDKTYESVNVYLMTDSNRHAHETRKTLDVKTPEDKDIKDHQNLIVTIDSAEYIAENNVLKEHNIKLENITKKRLTFEAIYGKKTLAEEKSSFTRGAKSFLTPGTIVLLFALGILGFLFFTLVT